MLDTTPKDSGFEILDGPSSAEVAARGATRPNTTVPLASTIERLSRPPERGSWLGTAGQPGGPPPRTEVETVSQVINGPDTQAPITALNCDGSACASTTYNGSTTVALSAKDPGGSGVQATYYTTDGSAPTTASPVFTAPFTISQTTTFKFLSVDNSGNTEAVQTQQVQVQPNADPVIDGGQVP